MVDERHQEAFALSLQRDRPVVLFLPARLQTVSILTRDSRKSRHKMATWQTFVKIAKIAAKTKHQVTSPKIVYKTRHVALTTIITCSARFSSVKFCHCETL